MYKHILLASDGSEHALRATDKTVSLINHHPDSKVTVLYVIGSSTSKTDVLEGVSREDIDARRKERLMSTEKKLKDANVEYDVQTIRGEPGPSIVQFANEHDFDLLILGSRGLNRLQEMVLGSVSHKVAKRVRCPVMIVK